MRAFGLAAMMLMGCGAGTPRATIGGSGLAGSWRYEWDYTKQSPTGQTSGKFVWKLRVEDSAAGDGVFFTVGACQFWAPLVSPGKAVTADKQECTVPAGETFIPTPPGIDAWPVSSTGTLKAATLELQGDKLSIAYDAQQEVVGQPSYLIVAASDGSPPGTREPPN